MVQVSHAHLAIVAMRGAYGPGQFAPRTRDLCGRVKRGRRARSGRCCQRCGWSIAIAGTVARMLCRPSLGVFERLFPEELLVDDAGVGAGGQAEKDEGEDEGAKAQDDDDPVDAHGNQYQEGDGGRAHQGIRDEHAGPVWADQAVEGKPTVLAPTQQNHAANILRPPAAQPDLVHQPLFPLASPFHAAPPLDEPGIKEGHSCLRVGVLLRLTPCSPALTCVSCLPVCCG